jgi:hypothetical protein
MQLEGTFDMVDSDEASRACDRLCIQAQPKAEVKPASTLLARKGHPITRHHRPLLVEPSECPRRVHPHPSCSARRRLFRQHADGPIELRWTACRRAVQAAALKRRADVAAEHSASVSGSASGTAGGGDGSGAARELVLRFPPCRVSVSVQKTVELLYEVIISVTSATPSCVVRVSLWSAQAACPKWCASVGHVVNHSDSAPL